MEKMNKKSRAWLEVDLNTITYNIEYLSNYLVKECEIMAVLKADGYNFGAVEIGKHLNSIGINNFAVATIEEGIELRKNNIQGEILILGYTSIEDLKHLLKYDLTQTIIDYEYGKTLGNSNLNLKVHIAIDTGMHRLGMDYKNTNAIAEIFNYKNLKVEGIYTHLCTSDGHSKEFEDFVNYQLENFNSVIEFLKEKNLKIPKKHIQASTGVINYPNFKSDFARLGVAVFGILCSKNSNSQNSKGLKEAISLKSRIISIRNVSKGEYIGYSQVYKAEKNMKIATVSIGYCDGYSRDFSNGVGTVLVNGRKTKTIGLICMDLLMIDITNMNNIKVNNIVTLLGTDGEESISLYELSEKSNTITIEVLSHFSRRLGKIYLK